MSLQRILVATDFSPNPRPALDYAAMLAAELHARLHLLYVSKIPDVVAGEARALGERFVDADIREGRAQLDSVLAELRGRGIAADGEVRTGFESDVIIEQASKEPYDLVVLGTHGRTGVRRLWMGSVAERVVRECPVPVLTVREPPAS